MKVFIVRPFGLKTVYKTNKENIPESVEINFDDVEKKLIKPAMQELGWDGGTTAEVFEAGDIREDMFSGLLLADIVIADITIHNANVFYELGIRHALRNRRTVLIKSGNLAETPFDILGYRYAPYKIGNLDAAIPGLVKMLKDTAATERVDSPVFNVLPWLEARDPEKYQALPTDFIEEVKIAKQTKQVGKLNLLSIEAESFSWKIPAYRLIGEALFKNKAWESARRVWEKIRNAKYDDIDANENLATIYQRLAESEMPTNSMYGDELLAKSDKAIETLLEDANLRPERRAEAYALKARNAKTRWILAWKQSQPSEQQERALVSQQLEAAIKNYERGFYENLNHFYSGINALGLLVTMIELAKNNPNTWEAMHATPEEAVQLLASWNKKLERLNPTVQVSIEAAKRKMEILEKTDEWLLVTEADYISLTNNNAARIKNAYAKVVTTFNDLNLDATVRQLRLYEQLNVKPDNVKAALSALPAESALIPEKKHFLLFTGHMIDKPDRMSARFPPEKENAVRALIKEKVEAEKNRIEGPILGIAGGACGSDILFHEVCAELGISTEMYLAFPKEQFAAESVSFAGAEWLERYYKLIKKLPNPVLSDTKEMPKWLQKRENYSIWERNNLWELNAALINGGSHMSLIAVWDGKGEDGPGGTQHMLITAKDKGAKVIVIDITKIK